VRQEILRRKSWCRFLDLREKARRARRARPRERAARFADPEQKPVE
jgi:hypothetical protein